ncbi:hypothetical protein J2S62_002217 [Enteractinococcus fodinae]|uniref:Uncharacterized protein n=1 Tax=Enteractinococcus fodinae TaxID=684663 RepID=A0ABU2B2Y5_9MICC|nr:hypothetical protein [Enteractinococcus fodinae]
MVLVTAQTVLSYITLGPWDVFVAEFILRALVAR